MPLSARSLRWLALSAIVAVLVTGFATPALATGGGWVVACTLSHSAMDDPIVFPGLPDASHVHEFFGNASTNAFSTYASMVVSGTSCSSASGDTAGYWLPALFQNGNQIDPNVGPMGIRVYYRKNNLASGTFVETIPPDLRVIAGNSHAASAADNPRLGRDIYWGCSDGSVGKSKDPPSSCASGRISMHLGFPNCWDGVLTHANDTVHLQYPAGGYCPAGFAHPLPRIIVRVEYPTPGTIAGPITLASGPTYTLHGDFWNTWQQSTLDGLVANCLNAGVACGTFFLKQ